MRNRICRYLSALTTALVLGCFVPAVVGARAPEDSLPALDTDADVVVLAQLDDDDEDGMDGETESSR